jgi:hypothetical protein
MARRSGVTQVRREGGTAAGQPRLDRPGRSTRFRGDLRNGQVAEVVEN